MAKKKRKIKRGLSRAADAYAMLLLWDASGGKVGRAPALKEGEEPVENPISFRDRRALLDSVTKLLAGEPSNTDEEEEDGIASFRERLNDGNRGTTEPGDGDSDDES